MDDRLFILWQYLYVKYLRRFRNRQQLLVWQHQQVVRFLTEVIPKSRFYRDRYQGLDLQNWQTFPPIDKATMMANFDDLNTVEIDRDSAFNLAIESEVTRDFSPTISGCTIGLSSGTSGNRGLFIVSKSERNIWAGTILAKALPRSIFTPECIAFFLRANSNLYETVQKQRIRFEYFDLLTPIEEHLDRLSKVSPTILVAPPSLLRLLATAKVQGKIDISPDKIIAVAEVLDPVDEGYISDCFDRPIHQLYQCTEGFLASTCQYGTLHLNEDLLVIQKEYIDRDLGKFVPIITDFNRQAQPIIRYRLDDILTERQSPCPCGSVLTALESIEGRCDDIFWLPNLTGEKSIPVFPDFIRRAIITASAAIEEYRVVQIDVQTIDIFLKVPPELRVEIEREIQMLLIELCERLHCQMPQICYQEYREGNNLDRKLRRIQREFSPDEECLL